MAKKKGGGGGANWQDTYGDLVTLLLCFFVLLYSMSSVSETKWEIIVNSFRRQTTASEPGSPGQGLGTGLDGDDGTVTVQDVSSAMAQVAMALNDYSSKNNLETMMSVTEGADYVFISFQNSVFFSGDSYALLDSGKSLLDAVAQTIEPQRDLIDEIRIMGHTSQGSPTQPNNPTVDRFLSSNRASVVTVYIQEKNVIDPDKLVSVGYGQWRPVSGYETEEQRMQNRRVEIMITGMDPDSAETEVDKYYVMREGTYQR